MRTAATKRRMTTILAITAVLALGGGAAFAYWTSTGTGSGTATTGTSVNFTVTSSAATGGPLTPGGPTASVAFKVTNPGTGTQNLSDVTVTVANADGSDWTAVAGCSDLDYTIGTPAITYGDIVAGGLANGTVTISMNNLASNQDGCKNAVVPLYFVAS